MRASVLKHHQAPGPSGVAYSVGFFMGFRLFIMLLAVWIFGTDAQTGVMADLSLNFFFLGLVFLDSFGKPRNQSFALLASAPSRWAMFFLFFSGCSLAWSVADSLPAAVAFWCAMAADTAMMILLLRSHPVHTVADSVMKGYVHGACLVAVIAWLLPTQADQRLGYDGLIGTNVIGFLCGFAFYLAQYLVLVRKQSHTPAMLLLGITLLRSLSKTTIIAFLISQTLLLINGRAISRRTKIIVSSSVLVVLLLFSGLVLAYIESYESAGIQADTLTGRIGIWAIMLGEGIERPWIGHGFHSVWNVIPPYGPDQFQIRHAHNELIQQFYAYGAVGVVMMLGLYGSFFVTIRKRAQGPLRIFLYLLLVFVLIRGIADTEVFDLSLPLWMIVLLCAVMQNRDTTPAVDIPRVESPKPPAPTLGALLADTRRPAS